MERSQFIKEVAPTIKNGTYRHIEYATDMLEHMTAAQKKLHQPGDLIKKTTTVVRLGIQYTHIAEIAQQIALQPVEERISDHRLKWGTWDPGCPYLIVHKEKYFLRCTVNKCPRTTSKNQYFYQGVEISKEELIEKGLLVNSYWNRNKPEAVFVIPLERITSI